MQDLHPKRASIRDVLSVTYRLPAYQRAYTWDTPDIHALIDSFLSGFRAFCRHGARGAGDDACYYLGSIVVDSDNALFDGQQRLTSVSLLLIHLHRRLLQSDPETAYKVKDLVYHRRLGDEHGSFSVSAPERDETMLSLLDGGGVPVGVCSDARRMAARYADIAEMLPEMEGGELADFAAWVATCVQVIVFTLDEVGAGALCSAEAGWAEGAGTGGDAWERADTARVEPAGPEVPETACYEEQLALVMEAVEAADGDAESLFGAAPGCASVAVDEDEPMSWPDVEEGDVHGLAVEGDVPSAEAGDALEEETLLEEELIQALLAPTLPAAGEDLSGPAEVPSAVELKLVCGQPGEAGYCRASGQLSLEDGRFRVAKGSIASKTENPLLKKDYVGIRETVLDEDGVFTGSASFKTLTAATSVVLGCFCDGLALWRDADGKTAGELLGGLSHPAGQPGEACASDAPVQPAGGQDSPGKETGQPEEEPGFDLEERLSEYWAGFHEHAFSDKAFAAEFRHARTRSPQEYRLRYFPKHDAYLQARYIDATSSLAVELVIFGNVELFDGCRAEGELLEGSIDGAFSWTRKGERKTSSFLVSRCVLLESDVCWEESFAWLEDAAGKFKAFFEFIAEEGQE